MALKKRTRRKIKRPSSGRAPYFTKDTQAAIHEFCESECHVQRAEIYRERIKNALEKLSENLIYIYGFHKQHDDIPNLKHSCVVNLYETLHKFDHTRGSNAFSYFNVVAKNWLIIQTRRKHKRSDRLVSIEDREMLSAVDQAAVAEFAVAPHPGWKLDEDERKQNIMKLLHHIKSKIRSESEGKCINAIITVFEKVDDLDFLNKRAVFVYVREISGLGSKQLSVCMSAVRKHYRELVGNGTYDIF